MTTHPLAEISAYADGELAAADAERVERHLASCTECARELALIRTMGDAMIQDTKDGAGNRGGAMWPAVHRRITQPVGWILTIAGVAVWAALAIVEWFRAGELTLRWLSTTAVGIGIALIAVAVVHQQYREWRSSPYKDVER